MMTIYRSLVDGYVSSGGIDGLACMFKLCFGRPGDDVEAELRLKRFSQRCSMGKIAMKIPTGRVVCVSSHLRSTIGTGSAVVSKVLLHVVVLFRNELLVIEIETSIS
jgi:hypothetical protein